MALSCIDSKLNLGASECKKLPQLLKGFITTPQEYTITAAEAASGTKWQSDLLLAKGARIVLWPQWAVMYENISEEQVLEETPLTAIGVRPGQYRFRFQFRENLELHKNMYSHRNSSGRVFLIDNENKIIGTSDDDGVTLKGLLLDNLLTEKLFFNDGSAVSKTPVGLYLGDNTDLDVRGFMVEGTSFVNALLSLTTVKLAEVGTSTATLVVVSVKSALDNVPIIGLVQADFILTGIAGTPSGVTEPLLDGVYEIAGATFTSGNVDLVTPALLTVQAYESSGPVAITI
jgi:hypothetical protein